MEKNNDKKIKIFSSRMQARLLLVFCVITLLLTSLIGRLIYIMQTDGDRYAKQVLSRQSYVSAVLPYKRGDILDRNGTVLARSELQFRLILDPKNLLLNSEYITQTEDALQTSFGIEPQTIRDILEKKPENQYVILLKHLKVEEVNRFKELMDEKKNIKSVWFEEEYVRSYPFDSLACDIVGFTSADNTGYFGIEEYYNEELNGTNGREYGYYDSALNIERIVKKAENGNSIVSTVDANVQRILQKNIKDFNAETGSKNIGILVMNPNTGEIIAMASNQEYNLNSPRSLEGIYPEGELAAMTQEQKTEALNKLWKNDIISYGYEPGSTFKPFTISAGLEENLVSENSTFVCDGGEHIGGYYIKCNKVTGHGTVTLGEALMKSCNDALMQVGALEGKDVFYRYENNFGFGGKTGIDLPGEEAGIITSFDNLNATELATSSFGQTFNVTMIQMASGFSSLVNGGKYYQPHIVKQIVNDEGATVKQFDPLLVRQTVSEKTSEFIQKYMYQTVELGTAKPAQVPGYSVGGKTGTAQKHPIGGGNYLVSFLGAVPAINPQVVIYIIVDEPQNVTRQDDSSIATKLASKVLTEILPALGIYPEGEINYLLPTDEEAAAIDEITPENSGDIEPDNGSTEDQQADTEDQQADTEDNGDNQGDPAVPEGDGTDPQSGVEQNPEDNGSPDENSGDPVEQDNPVEQNNPVEQDNPEDGSETQPATGTGGN